MTLDVAKKITEEVFSLYETYGAADYIGEPVSQLEHMCQAAQLAEDEGYGQDIILAAFFHDIGHLCENLHPVEQMDGYGVVDHEIVGAEFLRKMKFSEEIVRLVASHVQAKRYLTFKYPDYSQKLSKASQITLTQQGGSMTSEEAELFEADPLYRVYIKLREWDDKAKEVNQPLVPLNRFKQMAIDHLLHQSE